MVLPWSHRLPDYARADSAYGQNLVALASALASDGEPLTVLDVGANVGDSALQIMAAVDARVLCVEADEFYLGFLDENVGSDERVSVVEALLATSSGGAVKAVRQGGTTRFVADSDGASTGSVTPDALRAEHPDFDRLRLVKSDTDGYDVQLVPAIAQAWSDCSPVLFFEYDLRLSAAAGLDPLAVWSELDDLGYAEVAIWDNGGHPVGRAPIGHMTALSAQIDVPLRRRAFFDRTAAPVLYWDVAAVHRDDTDALAALRQLVPVALDAP